MRVWQRTSPFHDIARPTRWRVMLWAYIELLRELQPWGGVQVVQVAIIRGRIKQRKRCARRGRRNRTAAAGRGRQETQTPLVNERATHFSGALPTREASALQPGGRRARDRVRAAPVRVEPAVLAGRPPPRQLQHFFASGFGERHLHVATGLPKISTSLHTPREDCRRRSRRSKPTSREHARSKLIVGPTALLRGEGLLMVCMGRAVLPAHTRNERHNVAQHPRHDATNQGNDRDPCRAPGRTLGSMSCRAGLHKRAMVPSHD
mmetsp:Transcript_95272/g.308568  ORF Transcript_95272/g.308568 Transcript_95272/m.308568 type:complete len:263 (+) Transcript_95272:216-1004(+)